jgi:hypothetical protein
LITTREPRSNRGKDPGPLDHHGGIKIAASGTVIISMDAKGSCNCSPPKCQFALLMVLNMVAFLETKSRLQAPSPKGVYEQLLSPPGISQSLFNPHDNRVSNG